MSVNGSPPRPWIPRAFAALVGALLLTLPATGFASENKSSIGGRQSSFKTVILPIEGICSAGLADIREGLNNVSGIAKIEGSLKVEGIQVTYAPKDVSPDRIAKMIADLGYQTGSARTP